MANAAVNYRTEAVKCNEGRSCTPKQIHFYSNVLISVNIRLMIGNIMTKNVMTACRNKQLASSKTPLGHLKVNCITSAATAVRN